MNEPDKLGEVDRILSGRVNGAAKPEAKGAGVEADDIVELPEPGSPYQAFARAANKPVYTLHCLKGAEGVVSFAYVQIDSHCEFKATDKGQLIRLRFVGSKIWDVTISGIDLWRLYDLIGQHRMAWIRKADRGFQEQPGKEPIIMGIDIKEIEREA
jgi:hypothetical protein